MVIPWLTTEWVLSQFAEPEKKARTLYTNFILDGIHEPHRVDFHRGSFEGRILGDDSFSEKSLARAEEKFQCRLSMEQIAAAVSAGYGIEPEMLAEPGKRQPAAIGRAVVAYLVQEAENLTLTELSDYMRRDIAASFEADPFRAQTALCWKIYFFGGLPLALIGFIIKGKSEITGMRPT